MVGGLVGGVFWIFKFIGTVVFTILIGRRRATRSELRGARVYVGSALTFVAISCSLVFFLKRNNWLVDSQGTPLSLPGVFVSSGFIGALLGLLAALLLISYVESIEQQVEKERRYKRAYEKKYNELILKGIDPDEAAAQAAKHAAPADASACFLATAVYGDANAGEVIFLRKWRDACLLPYPSGRAFVRAYYFLSPRIAATFEQNQLLKSLTKLFIDRLIFIIKAWRNKGDDSLPD